MPANYDSIAGIYDLLSRMVFGRRIMDAQVCLLRFVPARSRILIAGGGTGWILGKLAEVCGPGLEIDYVESSARMIALSRKVRCTGNSVNFIHLPIENYSTDKPYDVIITPFIFDNFLDEKIEIVFAGLDGLLRNNGVWLYADFVYDQVQSHPWQRVLLKVMYLFFHLSCGIEAHQLVSMDKFFAADYIEEFDAYHYLRFIRSVAYRKRGQDGH